PDAATAGAFALALPNPQDSYVNEIDGGDFLVMPGMSIQTAVDAAGDGDTVTIANGTYVEQVIIDGKDITLEGESHDTVIQAFASMPNCITTANNNHAVVCVLNTPDATVQNLTIDGAGFGNTNNRFEGVAYRNAGGTVQDTVIKGIRHTPFNGTQNGVAAYLFNDDTVSRNFNLYTTDILDFQMDATTFYTGATTQLVADMRGNVITGVGPTTETAQNGMQVNGNLITGVIDGNHVRGIAYDSTS